MENNQISTLVWIVETIRNSGPITFEELNKKWQENELLSGGEPMVKRTFHKRKEKIWEMFGLEIECEQGGEYRYEIRNYDDIKRNSVGQWLLNTYSLTNSIEKSRAEQDKILLENIPSGQKYLNSIINAICNKQIIKIIYYNYWREDEIEHILMPLCVKLFKKRWYVVGKSCRSGSVKIYCLDRIRSLEITKETFAYPADFVPQDYFFGYYGVVHDETKPLETVRLKVSASQAKYIRDLPIQEGNQREVERNDDFSIFEIRIRPTYDFRMELLAQADEVEVLEPKWLREEMKETIKKMMRNYKNRFEKRGK